MPCPAPLHIPYAGRSASFGPRYRGCLRPSPRSKGANQSRAPCAFLRLATCFGNLFDACDRKRGFRARRLGPFHLHFLPHLHSENVLVRARELQVDDLRHLTVEKYILPKLFVHAPR